LRFADEHEILNKLNIFSGQPWNPGKIVLFMSLYYVQKLLYQLNRDERVVERFNNDMDRMLAEYKLTDEEIEAIVKPDIGLLYVLGVNGQILMHYAAMKGYAWPEYIQAMRDGIEEHGPVRAGLYTMTDGKGAV
jgi:hypothetical protein